MRELLDKIIQTDKGNNWWQPELFALNTQDKLPKELEIIKTPPIKEENYNCFIHALGLSKDSKLKTDCEGFLYEAFFRKLIEKGELKKINNPQKGDYILYRNEKNNPDFITHIGILEDKETVVSKWAWGPLLKHKIFDVPESYGNNISYIKAISKEKALELYNKYKEFNIK